jgi:hypothetical protein
MHVILPGTVTARRVLRVSAVSRSLAGVRLQLGLGLGIRAADGRVGASRRLGLLAGPGRFLPLHRGHTEICRGHTILRYLMYRVCSPVKSYRYILIVGLCILLRVYQPIYVETSVRNKLQTT